MSLLNRLFNSSSSHESHPAFQSGQILAASLIEGQDTNCVAPSEAPLLASASVSTESYVKERFLLRACAIEVAAQTRLLNQSDYDLVRGGIHHWFAFQAVRSDQFRAVYDTYKRRLPKYLAAARSESARGTHQRNELRISELLFTFADAITEANPGGQSLRDKCLPLALALAPIYWNTRFESSLLVYRQLGLSVSD